MKLKSILLIFVLVLLLAACGGDTPNDENVPRVVPTSTPAPTLTADERINFAAGLAENPLRMVIHPVNTIDTRIADVLPDVLELRGNITSQTEIEDELEDDDKFEALNEVLQQNFALQLPEDERENITTVSALTAYVQEAVGRQVSRDIFDLTGLYVDVILVEHYADALSDLCESGSGIVSIPWLDGMTYMAAASQNCGQPGLQIALAPEGAADLPLEIEVEAAAEATPETVLVLASERVDLIRGAKGVVIMNNTLGGSTLDLINDRNFCRISIDDFYSWFLPSLILNQANIDLLRAPAQVIEYESYEALLNAVEDGECAMTGVPASVFENAESETLQLVAQTADFPFGVLMYPLEVELGVRLSLNNNFTKLADDPVMGQRLRLLLGQVAILPAVPDDFADLTQFLTQSGYDFAQLGY